MAKMTGQVAGRGFTYESLHHSCTTGSRLSALAHNRLGYTVTEALDKHTKTRLGSPEHRHSQASVPELCHQP